ncbi:uncharacterized protein LAESUDRAFT_134676 [Laetiporus sulphureus 93-53]|uniref:Uncharacterized protein n=1 Tax=Laetiporus sulphureus 93-53 TaxID=1314785 RepID=A0A165EII3_9APHY|nr:uncharacterized protein LAESUDRAFT_134676 [Laetiporus sulphureus 93-53]KZT07123.1 hypothetical protein LAESUDRAFT_134676 [Laetiporus sulphureus 93-53]
MARRDHAHTSSRDGIGGRHARARRYVRIRAIGHSSPDGDQLIVGVVACLTPWGIFAALVTRMYRTLQTVGSRLGSLSGQRPGPDLCGVSIRTGGWDGVRKARTRTRSTFRAAEGSGSPALHTTRYDWSSER